MWYVRFSGLAENLSNGQLRQDSCPITGTSTEGERFGGKACHRSHGIWCHLFCYDGDQNYR